MPTNTPLKKHAALMVSALALVTLNGCAFMPEGWKNWLAGTGTEQETQPYYYDYRDPGAVTDPYAQQGARQEPGRYDAQEGADGWTDGPPDLSTQRMAGTYGADAQSAGGPRFPNAVPAGYKRAVFKGDPEKRLSRVENDVRALKERLRVMMPALQALVDAQSGLSGRPGAQGGGSGGPFHGDSAEQGDTVSETRPRVLYPGTEEQAGDPRANSGRRPAQYGSWTPPKNDRASRARSAYAEHSSPVAKKIRFGRHKEKTRIVIDLGAPADYSYDVHNGDGYVSVTLPNVRWNAAMQGSLRRSPILQSYNVQQHSGTGSRLILNLRAPVRVLKAGTLPPNATYPNHRIYFDIAAR